MSKDLNKCCFIGRLGQDPEYRENATVKACNFSIACGDDYKDKSGNQVEKTNWIPAVTFGRLAEICSQYLAKGSQVYIEGKFETRKWQDKDNNDRYTTEIKVYDMQMLGSKSDNQGGQSGYQAPQQNNQQQNNQPRQNAPMANNDFDDEIPF